MSFFYNGDPEEVFLFVRKPNMALAAPGTLEVGAKVRYIRTLVWREFSCQFDSLSADVESENPLTVENIIEGLDL